MIMIKTLGHFLLLFILCFMLVYAPEILSAVSSNSSLSAAAVGLRTYIIEAFAPK